MQNSICGGKHEARDQGCPGCVGKYEELKSQQPHESIIGTEKTLFSPSSPPTEPKKRYADSLVSRNLRNRQFLNPLTPALLSLAWLADL